MLLKNEICFGQKCLSLAADLRDECLRLRDNAKERRKSEKEEKKKEKEKEERRILKALSAPELSLTTGLTVGGSGKKKIRKKKELVESATTGEDELSLDLDGEKSSKVRGFKKIQWPMNILNQCVYVAHVININCRGN